MAGLNEVLSNCKKVAIDTTILNSLFDLSSNTSEYVRSIFKEIEFGNIEGVLSIISLGEILVPVIKASDDFKEKRLKLLLTHFPNLQIVEVGLGIMETASSLQAKHNLPLADSIVAATALKSDADIFLTTNIKFTNVLENAFVLGGQLQEV